MAEAASQNAVELEVVRAEYEAVTGKPWPRGEQPDATAGGGVVAEPRRPMPPLTPRARARPSPQVSKKRDHLEYTRQVDSKLLRTRILTARPAVDTGRPPQYNHLKQKLKHLQHELEKQAEIDLENEWLQRRLKTMPSLAFGGPIMRRPDKPTNPGYDLIMEKARLRNRIRDMTPATDTTSPRMYKHLSENLKGKQIVREKREEIRRNNKISLQRLAAMTPMSRRKGASSRGGRKGGSQTERGTTSTSSIGVMNSTSMGSTGTRRYLRLCHNVPDS